MLGHVLEALFPRTCAGCSARAWPFCPACLENVGWLTPPGCRRCGRPFEVAVEACPDCPPAPVAWARAPLHYEGPVRLALMRMKFGGQRSVADALAPLMVRAVEPGPALPGQASGRGGVFDLFDPMDRLGVDRSVLTWVPLGRARRRARGFDQAEALARAVGKLVGVPVPRLLERVVETDPQARRSGTERRRALRGAFRATRPAPGVVVLVDDVLTSGATAAAAASTLRLAGAGEVGVLTAARSLGGPLPARCYTRAGTGLGLWLPGGGLR